MKKLAIGILFSAGLLIASPAPAHMLWLNVDSFQPSPGETVHIEVGWGHKFPTDEVIKEGMLVEIYALDDSGRKVAVEQVSPMHFTFSPESPGVYRIAAGVHPGFVSKTTRGYKLAPKTDLQEVLSCFRHDIRTKAVLLVAGAGAASGRQFAEPAGAPLEIIPLASPNQLRAGDVLPLRVVYQGKPLPGACVRATYAGFSDQPGTFASTTETDERGEAKVTLEKQGSWLVTVSHTMPYHDPEVCDEYRYKHSITFRVK
jgi:uncharacterized GH25 family protein